MDRSKYAHHSKVFWEFYESNNDYVKLEYKEQSDAIKCQKAICMLMNRKRIYDVRAIRRKNILYLNRGANLGKIEIVSKETEHKTRRT